MMINFVVIYVRVLLNLIKQCLYLLRCAANTIYKGKSLLDYHVFVVGPLCIDKPYKGTDMGPRLFYQLLNSLPSNYDFMITFVSEKNQRSMKACKKAGLIILKLPTTIFLIYWCFLCLPVRKQEAISLKKGGVVVVSATLLSQYSDEAFAL